MFWQVKKIRNLAGYTLVELMITISIIGILTAVMIPAVRTFDRKNKLAVASEEVKGAIIEARNYAMSPRFDDTKPKIYAVRFKDLTKNEYSIGYWDIDQSEATILINATTPVTAEADWKSHWHNIADKAYPSGVLVGQGDGDVCPNLNSDNGPGKASELNIGFSVPYARPIFDLNYNFDNRAGNGVCTPNSSTLWTATGSPDPSGGGFIKMCSKDAPADCKKIFVHSYSGQVSVK